MDTSSHDRDLSGPTSEAPSCVSEAEGEGLRERLRRYEIKLILEALDAAGGNQTQAARLLKIPLRTLVHKMKVLGIRRRSYEAGG
jgi:DNA-binding NtrC family response regulator